MSDRFTVESHQRHFIIDQEGNDGRGRAIAITTCLPDAEFICEGLNVRHLRYRQNDSDAPDQLITAGCENNERTI